MNVQSWAFQSEQRMQAAVSMEAESSTLIISTVVPMGTIYRAILNQSVGGLQTGQPKSRSDDT